MTMQQRHKNLSDARDILMANCAGMPAESPVRLLLRSAYEKLDAQMAIIETLLLADEQHECGECGAIVENGETHDCPAADWNDTSAGQYAANVTKVM